MNEIITIEKNVASVEKCLNSLDNLVETDRVYSMILRALRVLDVRLGDAIDKKKFLNPSEIDYVSLSGKSN